MTNLPVIFKSAPLLSIIVVIICHLTASKVLYANDTFQPIEIPSSFNPVGSGARALGMGGAFIAVADDATAASWNPGGLTQLVTPEISAVGDFFHRTEDNTFGTNPEASGEQDVSKGSLNYLSATYPFNVFGYNMVVSANYQNLYDFTREWQFPLSQTKDSTTLNRNIDCQQKGSLSAYGLAYAIQVLPSLSFGFTLNLWQNGIYNNQWTKTVQEEGTEFHGSKRLRYQSYSLEEFDFTGFNANLGLMWRITQKLTVGGVFKTPFSADLKQQTSVTASLVDPNSQHEYSSLSETSTDYGKLEMPMSYGIGLAYRLSDALTLAADVYRTEWGDFVHKSANGTKTCPITGLPESQSDVGATHQIRIGGEYLFINPDDGYSIPLRGGIFYDPAPAQGSPDVFYGVSLGSGIAWGRFVFDLAYQYRFGNQVSKSILKNFDFSQDVREHTLYASVIFYF